MEKIILIENNSKKEIEAMMAAQKERIEIERLVYQKQINSNKVFNNVMAEGDKPVEKKEKTKRAPTEYNLHMARAIALAKEQNPGISHKDAFKLASSTWDKSVKSNTDGTKKSKRIKKEKDEDGQDIVKEKRAPSPYNLYMRDRIPEVKSENPGISHKDAFRRAANDWNLHKSILLREKISKLPSINKALVAVKPL